MHAGVSRHGMRKAWQGSAKPGRGSSPPGLECLGTSSQPPAKSTLHEHAWQEPHQCRCLKGHTCVEAWKATGWSKHHLLKGVALAHGHVAMDTEQLRTAAYTHAFRLHGGRPPSPERAPHGRPDPLDDLRGAGLHAARMYGARLVHG